MSASAGTGGGSLCALSVGGCGTAGEGSATGGLAGGGGSGQRTGGGCWSGALGDGDELIAVRVVRGEHVGPLDAIGRLEEDPARRLHQRAARGGQHPVSTGGERGEDASGREQQRARHEQEVHRPGAQQQPGPHPQQPLRAGASRSAGRQAQQLPGQREDQGEPQPHGHGHLSGGLMVDHQRGGHPRAEQRQRQGQRQHHENEQPRQRARSGRPARGGKHGRPSFRAAVDHDFWPRLRPGRLCSSVILERWTNIRYIGR